MLDKLFNAESIAVIGASKKVTKRGYQTISTLLHEKYEGMIFPVNPKEKKILGLVCFPTVSAIPHDIDLALITTPARTLPSILEDCGKKGVKGAVVIAGGFSEVGEKGGSLEKEVVQIAQKYGIRLIGPNTSGMMNQNMKMNLVGIRDTPAGDIALLCQSGNMALTLITEAKLKSNKGISCYVGVGNEADIKFHEYLEYFENDSETKVILIYMEGMKEGRKFLQQAYKASLKKPIVMLKGGRSQAGKKSAGSHTGAIAGMTEVARSAFKRSGIILIDNSDELFPVSETLSTLPVIHNKNIAILADGGGHATIASDLLSDFNINIPQVSKKTRARLERILPEAASTSNPVDVAGGSDEDPSILADCADILLRDNAIGGLLLVGLFGGYGIRFSEKLTFMEEDAAHKMGKMVKKYNKPIVVHSLYNTMRTHPLELLRYYGITVYDSLDISCKCISALSVYGNYLKGYHARASFDIKKSNKSKKSGKEIIQNARDEGRHSLFEFEAKELFRLHGAEVSKDGLAQSSREAISFFKTINDNVAMKIVSSDILHKSDLGCVKLDLSTQDEVRQAYTEIIKNAKNYNHNVDIKGILISPMSKTGTEVIIGTKIDDQFGPVIMYGLGGILVEVMKDVSFRVLPISKRSAKLMIRETNSYPILTGIRGRKASDTEALRKLLMICSEIALSYPEIQEIDLNPVIVHEVGISVVDARILLKEDN